MPTIKTYGMPNSSILRIYSDQEVIKVDPQYQRKGDVWPIEKKQLLIDSILNEYDIPKLYFHSFSSVQKDEFGGEFDYAIIDGRQRIQALYEFIDGKYSLDREFVYLADSNVRAGGMTYTELALNYPKLKIRFDAFTLPVVLVETDDLDLIEDMFSRLNEAVPLNSAEKRNAYGGYAAQQIRILGNHDFFARKVRFRNNRLQHLEVSARLLFLEYSLQASTKIVDTKKPFLDKMVLNNRDETDVLRSSFQESMAILDILTGIFIDNDVLLRAQSMISIYYLLIREARRTNSVGLINRPELFAFFEKIDQNRTIAEQDITLANYEYLEYDRLSQQGTNDASSIKERVRVIANHFNILVEIT